MYFATLVWPDIDAELEQLAMNAGRAPEGVGHAHGPDQLTDLHRNLGSPAAPPGFPAPKRSKSSTVPTNHGLGPDDGQRIYNSRNKAIHPNEHQSVESPEGKSLRRVAPQYIDLLTENQESPLQAALSSEASSSAQTTAT